MSGARPYGTLNFYRACEARVVEVFSRLPGVRAVYRFGTIRAVGHSDIDLMFVVDPETYEPRSIPRLLAGAFTRDERYLVAQHPQWIVPEQIAAKVNVIRPATNLVRLWGQQYDVEPVDDAYVRLYILCDLLVDYYPRLLDDNRRAVGKMLQFVNAVRYIVGLHDMVRAALRLDTPATAAVLREVLDRNDAVRGALRETAAERVVAHVREAMDAVLAYTAEAKAGLARYLVDQAMREVPADLADQARIGAMVFTDTVPVHTRHVVLTWRGKSVAFFANPRPLYYLFARPDIWCPPLRAAILYRNEILSHYAAFNRRYNGGGNIYVPWWERSGGHWADRLRRLVCDAYALMRPRMMGG